MVRFQVFDAITGEETSEDALPRDIQGILNRYKSGSQGGGGGDLSRLARRQGQGMVGAGASGSYGRTRPPNNRLGKGGRFDISGIPKTQEELEEDADASYRYGAAPFDLFLGRGETFIDPTRGKAFLEGQSEEERAAGFQAFLENARRLTPNYTLAEQRADRTAVSELATYTAQGRGDGYTPSLVAAQSEAVERRRIEEENNALRNSIIPGLGRADPIPKYEDLSAGQQAFSDQFDVLFPAIEELQDLGEFFDRINPELLGQLEGDLVKYRKGGYPQDLIDLTEERVVSLTDQFVENRNRLEKLEKESQQMLGLEASLEEILDIEFDILNMDKNDIYRAGLLAVQSKELDSADGVAETAGRKDGTWIPEDMTDPEQAADAFNNVLERGLVQTTGEGPEYMYEYVRSEADAVKLLSLAYSANPVIYPGFSTVAAGVTEANMGNLKLGDMEPIQGEDVGFYEVVGEMLKSTMNVEDAPMSVSGTGEDQLSVPSNPFVNSLKADDWTRIARQVHAVAKASLDPAKGWNAGTGVAQILSSLTPPPAAVVMD